MVEIVVLLFLPPIMLLRVDCVIPLIIANLLIVILFFAQSSIIRNRVASPMFKPFHLKIILTILR